MEIVRIVICLSVFLFSYSAFSQDCRFVREVEMEGAGFPAVALL